MIVKEEIKETVGRCGGLYSEDRPRFETKIFCDRCGIEKLEGSDGLGWSMINPVRSIFDTEDKNGAEICPDCLKTEDEFRSASINLQKYINHSLWARGSNIGRMLKAIEEEQRILFRDCSKVKTLLKKLHPQNKQGLLNKIRQAMKSARLVEEVDVYDIFNPPASERYP